MAVAEALGPSNLPVDEIAPGRLAVRGLAGEGSIPVFVSEDWARPLPDVKRIVIVLHGRLRNAATYFRSALHAMASAGPAARDSLVVAPQFLAQTDVQRHGLPPDLLRWSLQGWMGGGEAEAPAPLSSFDALDALLARLADRNTFPGLRVVVVAGHSGGGQVAQRYAVLGRGAERLEHAGLEVRFVVANPSSYVYFSPERPLPQGGFAVPRPGRCPGFDDWKYGLRDLPPYAHGAGREVEAAYVRRQVIYLLGAEDTDPEQPALDRSAAACAQGPHRLARGRAYFTYLRERHPGLVHRLVEVPEVGHDGDAMLTSAQGLAALFAAR